MVLWVAVELPVVITVDCLVVGFVVVMAIVEERVWLGPEEVEAAAIVAVVEVLFMSGVGVCPDTNTEGRRIPDRRRHTIPVQTDSTDQRQHLFPRYKVVYMFWSKES